MFLTRFCILDFQHHFWQSIAAAILFLVRYKEYQWCQMIEVEEYEDRVQTIIIFKEVVGGLDGCSPHLLNTHHIYITYIRYIHNIYTMHIIVIYDTYVIYMTHIYIYDT